MGPIKTGFVYGLVAVAVAAVTDLYFLVVDPAGTPDWILAVIHTYHTRLAFAAYVFLALLAALRVRPTRLDPGVPYHSLLLRDGALAATVVGVVVGVALLLLTLLQATALAGAARDYANEAAPAIVRYVNGEIVEIREGREDRDADTGNLPPPANVREVESALQPPAVRDLGRSLASFVMRAIVLGTLGGLVGALRGRSAGDGSGSTDGVPGGVPAGDAKPREG